MTDKRRLAKDRRRAAVHEAGHIIVGRYYRMPMSGWIARNDAPATRRVGEYIGEAKSEKPIEDRTSTDKSASRALLRSWRFLRGLSPPVSWVLVSAVRP